MPPSFASLPDRLLEAPRRARTLRRIVVLAALACAPLAAQSDELQDVSKLVTSNQLDEAEKKADAFLAKTPKDAQMRFLKGVILAQRNKRDEAVAVFTSISQDYPELPEPYNNVATIYAARGQYDNARLALESAIRVAPNYATAYENLGDVYVALAARAYQDARRYDGKNAAALRKLDAARSLLAGKPVPTAAASEPAPAPAAAVVEPTRSQRNVGLPSPAGPRVTVGGFGAVAPEIVVPADARSIPQGSNVVAIDNTPSSAEGDRTTTLTGATTVVASDPAQPIADVTAAVKRWTQTHSVTAEGLRIRIDGDAAVAQFREIPVFGKRATVVQRALDLRRDGTSWSVTGERTES